MADVVSRWVRCRLPGLVQSGPIQSEPDQSVADIVVVPVAWSVAGGAPFVRSMFLFWTSPFDAWYL